MNICDLSHEISRFGGTVAIWFRAHCVDDQRDWNNICEFGGNFHPLLGYYQSDDPDILKLQLKWIRRAGIDLIVYDAYPVISKSLFDLSRDKTLQLLIQELSNQTNESRKLKLCIWLEKYLSNPTIEEYRFALDYVRQNISNYEFYFRYKGRPLLLCYINNLENRPLDEIEVYNDYFEIRRVRPFYCDVWSYIEYYPQRLQKECISACPGFDSYIENAYIAKYIKKEKVDFEELRKISPKADRENGVYYEKQLSRAKSANPDIIFISGWNDWQYSNQIEPAIEYEFKYVDLTAKCLGRWEETAPYR